MKKRIPTFVAGMLTTALIGGLGISALAASGAMTITVDPINIQVNGQTFQPKDAQGADVPVFAYNGTTYAPLRALAEAYGLEVGYDAEANMATVGEVAPSDSLSPNGAEDIDLKRINITLVKVDEKYYAIGSDDNRHGAPYTIATVNDKTLLFTSDIHVNTEGVQRKTSSGEYESFAYCSSWYFNYILRLALMDEYDVSASNNPYLDGVLNITSPSMTLDELLNCGVEETLYLSASDSFTPMWVEYNGHKLYNQQDHTQELSEVDGIRYIDGMVCMNDVLAYFDINKTISVGEYNGAWYLEIK